MSGALKPRKQPTQDRSAKTVEAIVEAAIRVLQQGGWAKFTTTRVAERAGISVGSLYQYFPNRESIGVAVVRQRTRVFLAALIEAEFPRPATLAETTHRAMAIFLAEKRRTLGLSLILQEAMPEIGGRQAILEEARTYVPALQAKFFASSGVALGATALSVALAAVEGAVWEALRQDPSGLNEADAVVTLAGIFEAALGDLNLTQEA